MLGNISNEESTCNNDSTHWEEKNILSNKEIAIINSNRSMYYLAIILVVKKFHEYKERISNKYFQKL